LEPFPRVQVLEVLASYGIMVGQRADNTEDPTEEVILVPRQDFDRVDVREVTISLMRVLPGKKVWLVPDTPGWKSTPI
jgi:hypothetical protein